MDGNHKHTGYKHKHSLRVEFLITAPSAMFGFVSVS